MAGKITVRGKTYTVTASREKTSKPKIVVVGVYKRPQSEGGGRTAIPIPVSQTVAKQISRKTQSEGRQNIRLNNDGSIKVYTGLGNTRYIGIQNNRGNKTTVRLTSEMSKEIRNYNQQVKNQRSLNRQQTIRNVVQQNTASGRLITNSMRIKKIRSELIKIDKAPYRPEVKKALKSELYSYAQKKESNKPLNVVNVYGFGDEPYYTNLHKVYLQTLNVVLRGQDKVASNLRRDFEKRNYDVEFNKLYPKIVTGLGKGFRALGSVPRSTANILGSIGISNMRPLVQAQLKKKGYVLESSRLKTDTRYARNQALKELPGTVGRSYDPRKPENWINILLTLVGTASLVKGVKTTKLQFQKNYVPSTRNAVTFRAAAKTQLRGVAKAKKIVQKNIKQGLEVTANKRLLKVINKVENNLQKGIIKVNKAINNPKVLKLSDFNPFMNAAKALRQIARSKELSHASAVAPKKVFGQTFKVLKDFKELKTKLPTKARREVTTKSSLEKAFIQAMNKQKGILTGGRAQNVYVKARNLRKSVDFDVFYKNPREAAIAVKKSLAKQFPKTKFSIQTYKPASQPGMIVYRLKVNGKLFADFDKLPKGGVPFNVVKGVRVAKPEFLLKRKVSTIGDVGKFTRQSKDLKDIQRLVGSKKISNKIKDAPKEFTVRGRPQSMGADRIKFREDFLFWDLEVPTAYAYQSLIKPFLPARIIKGLSNKIPKSKLLKVVSDKLNKYGYIKSNARITSFRVKTRVSSFPKKLQVLIKKAHKGQLSKSQVTKLRRDLVKHVKDNPNKIFKGTRTSSLTSGEREAVTASMSKLQRVKKGQRVSFDPETKVLIKDIELAFKKTGKTTPKAVSNKLSRLSIKDLRTRFFTPKDWLKIRRYTRSLRKAERLSKGQYNDIVTTTLKMLKSKKAVKTLGRKTKFVSELPKRKGVKARKPSIDRAVGGVKSKRSSNKQSSRSTAIKGRSKSKSTSQRTSKPARQARRVASNSRSRSTTRTYKRKTSRSKTRSRPRTTPRARTTPRERPRTTPRARTTPRERPRSRQRTRARTRPKNRFTPKALPLRFRRKKKRLTQKDKKLMDDWLKKQPKKYRPSLAAVLFDIHGYKPKGVTGLEIRPLIKK